MWNLIKTKTFWTGIASIGAGVWIGYTTRDWTLAADKVLFGVALITGRQAIAKLEPKPKKAKAKK